MSSHVSQKSIVVMVGFLMVACSNSIREQDTAGSLQGVVTSSSGDPVSGAFVKLKNAERRLTFMVISQAEGRYTASNLPAGKYVVQGVGGDHQSSPSPVDVVAAGYRDRRPVIDRFAEAAVSARVARKAGGSTRSPEASTTTPKPAGGKGQADRRDEMRWLP